MTMISWSARGGLNDIDLSTKSALRLS